MTPDLLTTYHDVLDRFSDVGAANAALPFGRLLDYVEREHAALETTKPQPYANDWDARPDVRDAHSALKLSSDLYANNAKWLVLDEVENTTRSKFWLRDLWRLWETVQTAARDLRKLPKSTSARRRIDAEMDVDRARTLYDHAYRAFYGIRQLSWDERISISGLKPPKSKPRDPQRRAISTYTGNKNVR